MSGQNWNGFEDELTLCANAIRDGKQEDPKYVKRVADFAAFVLNAYVGGYEHLQVGPLVEAFMSDRAPKWEAENK